MYLNMPLVAFTPQELFTVTAIVEQKSDAIKCSFLVTGPINILKIKSLNPKPKKQNNLWLSTCFEIFVGSAKNKKYREWNFCTSHDWYSMEFSDYRKRLKKSTILMPNDVKVVELQKDCLFCFVDIPLDQKVASDLTLGVAAILENNSGEKSYWALKHASEVADFHDGKCFMQFSGG